MPRPEGCTRRLESLRFPIKVVSERILKEGLEFTDNRFVVEGNYKYTYNNGHLIRSLFESVIPYFDAGEKPSEEVLKLKMIEGVYVLLNTDINLYASLFDFVEPWKIDILDYLNENYMCDLSMNEIASYTGRSLATFKRDFAKVSDLTPQKWIIKRRLEAAHDLIKSGKKKVTEACFDVGFKNLSHFSKIYKEAYGVAPSM